MRNINSSFSKLSFTLIELLIVIAILGILSSLISGNFITSLKKGRDTKRKSDIEQIQKALEMYYEDNNKYPLTVPFREELCHPDGCPTQNYMFNVPQDPKTGYNYVYDSDGTYYKIYSYIENKQDEGPGVNQAGYGIGIICGPSSEQCKFGVSSPNISLE